MGEGKNVIKIYINIKMSSTNKNIIKKKEKHNDGSGNFPSGIYNRRIRKDKDELVDVWQFSV